MVQKVSSHIPMQWRAEAEKKNPKQMGENFLSTLRGLNPTHDERMVFSLNRNNNMNVILSFISN